MRLPPLQLMARTDGPTPAETFRVRPATFAGLFAAAALVAALGCVVWAFGVPHAELIGPGLGAVLALVALVLLARRPRLATLDDAGVQVRGRRLDWDEISKVQQLRTEQGSALEIVAAAAERPSLLVPLRWLSPDDARRLGTRLTERANVAAGYRHVGTDPADEPAERLSKDADSPQGTGTTESNAPVPARPAGSGWSRTGRSTRSDPS